MFRPRDVVPQFTDSLFHPVRPPPAPPRCLSCIVSIAPFSNSLIFFPAKSKWLSPPIYCIYNSYILIFRSRISTWLFLPIFCLIVFMFSLNLWHIYNSCFKVFVGRAQHFCNFWVCFYWLGLLLVMSPVCWLMRTSSKILLNSGWFGCLNFVICKLW